MTIFAAAAIAAFDWFDYRGDDPLPKSSAGEYASSILQEESRQRDFEHQRAGSFVGVTFGVYAYQPGVAHERR